MSEKASVYCAEPKFSVWKLLGFGTRHAPRLDEDEAKEGWAISWFVVETFARLDWRDRMRVLISGNVYIDHAIKTDVPIARSYATSAISVLPPGRA